MFFCFLLSGNSMETTTPRPPPTPMLPSGLYYQFFLPFLLEQSREPVKIVGWHHFPRFQFFLIRAPWQERRYLLSWSRLSLRSPSPPTKREKKWSLLRGEKKIHINILPIKAKWDILSLILTLHSPFDVLNIRKPGHWFDMGRLNWFDTFSFSNTILNSNFY